MQTTSKSHLNALISPRVVDFNAGGRRYDEIGTEIHSVRGIAGPFEMLSFLQLKDTRKENATRRRANKIIKQTFTIVC